MKKIELKWQDYLFLVLFFIGIVIRVIGIGNSLNRIGLIVYFFFILWDWTNDCYWRQFSFNKKFMIAFVISLVMMGIEIFSNYSALIATYSTEYYSRGLAKLEILMELGLPVIISTFGFFFTLSGADTLIVLLTKKKK